MWIALNWSLVAFTLAAWSGLCLLLNAAAQALGSLQGRPSDWLAALDNWQLPLWLTDWLPMPAITALKAWLTDSLAALAPWLDMAAGLWPAWAGEWLAPLLWLCWGAGALGLLALGGVGHMLVRALTASRAPQASRPMATTPAATRQSG